MARGRSSVSIYFNTFPNEKCSLCNFKLITGLLTNKTDLGRGWSLWSVKHLSSSCACNSQEPKCRILGIALTIMPRRRAGLKDWSRHTLSMTLNFCRTTRSAIAWSHLIIWQTERIVFLVNLHACVPGQSVDAFQMHKLCHASARSVRLLWDRCYDVRRINSLFEIMGQNCKRTNWEFFSGSFGCINFPSWCWQKLCWLQYDNSYIGIENHLHI